MKGLASVVALILVVLISVAGIVLLASYTISQAELGQKLEARTKALVTSQKDYLRIDSARWEGNVLTINITAIAEPVELNSINVFVDHIYRGSCSDLNCSDQTGNGFLITGESGEINVPYRGDCAAHITLEYAGSTTSKTLTVCVWRCRRTVTVTSSFSDTSYPVRVELNSSNFDFSASDGNDIRFYDGNTKLPYWVEDWNADVNKAILWVKVDVVAGDKNIYMYYCNPNAPPESNGYAVFTWFNFDDTNLLAVFHFDEGAGTITSSVVGGFEGNLAGDTAWTTGRFGYALSFDGNDDWVETNFDLNYTDLTYIVWVNANPPADGVGKVIHDGSPNRAVGVNTGPYPYVLFDTNGDPTYDLTTAVSGGWYALAARVSGSSLTEELFVNGVLKATGTLVSLAQRTGPLFFGSEGGTGFDYNGLIDEAILFGRLLTNTEVNALSSGYFDYLSGVWVVRKRTDPEPTTSVGSEETGEWVLN